jgi:hypothetical protein
MRPDGVVVVASPVPGRDTAQADAEAVLTVMQLRRLTWQADTPIVGQVYLPLQAFDLKANPWLAVISSQHVMSAVLALVVFQSLPAVEQLLGGEHAHLEVHQYPSGGDHTTFGAIYDRALADRTVVLGLAHDGEAARLNPQPDTPVRPGDKLLLARALGSGRTQSLP